MPRLCPLVRVDSKHHFQYVEDCIPANRAVIQLLRNVAGKAEPTGVILVYKLLTTDEIGADLQTAIIDPLTSVDKASTAIINHARMCILPSLNDPGDLMAVSFIGKTFNSVEQKWKSSGNYDVVRKS